MKTRQHPTGNRGRYFKIQLALVLAMALIAAVSFAAYLRPSMMLQLLQNLNFC